MKKLHYKEQDLQIRCVKWFRVTYPEFACLMFHPKNEEAGGRERGVIAKKEGVQAGVSDLLFLIPTQDYHFLAIEMKSKKGRQSKEQKAFQRYVIAAGGKYLVIRSFEDFTKEVTKYMDDITPIVWGDIGSVYDSIEQERTEEARREMDRIINNKQ